MTIINGIEIDGVEYRQNHIKMTLTNNEPTEEKLHVVIVISNPCGYATRYILAKEFIKRMQMEETGINLYIVELAYKDQKYYLTDKKNPQHLQLRTEVPLWHKENMINLGVRHLLPATWKAMAWIDADIEFENHDWALDTLKILNGGYDIVQLFSHACDMDFKKHSMSVFNSFGYCHVKNTMGQGGVNYPHPGYAWAITRNAYEKINGLYEYAILGSGDHVMAKALVGKGSTAINPASHKDYFKSIEIFEEKAKLLRLGYVPGVIRHHWHGSKVNRKYMERWEILIKHDYSPAIHLTKDAVGLLIPTSQCPSGLLADIVQYGKDRNEDEGRKGLKGGK